MFVGPFQVLHGYPPRMSRDHPRTLTLPAPSRRGPLRDSTEDRRIGLNMNYSIIFIVAVYTATIEYSCPSACLRACLSVFPSVYMITKKILVQST